MAKKPNWTKIQAEYVTGSASYAELAKKHKVSLKTLTDHGRSEGWVELRKQNRHETATKAAEVIGERQVSNLARINTIADSLLDKLEKAVGELDLKSIEYTQRRGDKYAYNQTKTVKYESGGVVDQKALRELTAALKDLREVKGIQSELAKQEQEARIALLRKNAEKEEEKDNQIILTVDGGDDLFG